MRTLLTDINAEISQAAPQIEIHANDWLQLDKDEPFQTYSQTA